MSSEASNPLSHLGGLRNLLPSFDADRVGVLASVLCAIHCAATPFLLLMLPTFGKFWAHPASHWGMAIIVVPIALLMMSKGYQRHRRAWILAIGTTGILLVLAGALAPYFENTSPSTGSPTTTESNSDQSASGISEDGKCTDSCCPSLVTDEAGKQRLEVPTASVLTTAGGIFLIGTHLGNLCCCPSCRRKHRGKA